MVAALLLCVAACARTGLYPGDTGDDLGVGEPGATTGGASSGGAAQSGAGLTAIGGTPAVVAGRPSMPPETSPPCEPSAETCNGRDDDCNGAVDDVPAEACPGGGARFCVAGRLSECPRRCDVCSPGSFRVCQNPFCSFWGEQECAGDGQGFGHCRETEPPPACAAIARKFKDSKELEQCCLDNGYCCLDEQDLDRDGDRHEMLGACGDVVCQ